MFGNQTVIIVAYKLIIIILARQSKRKRLKINEYVVEKEIENSEYLENMSVFL